MTAHDKGRDCRRTDEVLDNYRHRAMVAEAELARMTRPCDPVGAVEIAERLNVKRRTVDQWRQRRIGFPEPRWTVGGRPAWDWPDIAAWDDARWIRYDEPRAGLPTRSTRP